jgi:hypothetical protein
MTPGATIISLARSEGGRDTAEGSNVCRAVHTSVAAAEYCNSGQDPLPFQTPYCIERGEKPLYRLQLLSGRNFDEPRFSPTNFVKSIEKNY